MTSHRAPTTTTNDEHTKMMMMQNKGWIAILVESVTRIIGYHNNEPILPITAPGGPSPPPSPSALARDVWFQPQVAATPVLPIHAIHVSQSS
jgi:hypothetical protein